MSALLTIGEFAQATHLSVKALRHYDEVGLLQPADVDQASGYRRYAAAQVPTALVIRRFRDLDMPLDQIRTVLEAPDAATRDEAIVDHLERMQQALADTQATVRSLQALLEGKDPRLHVEFRHIVATPAIAISEAVEWDTIEAWLEDALDTLRLALPSSTARDGPDAALYSTEVFETHAGEVVAFIPVRNALDTSAPVRMIDIPPVDAAVAIHSGPFSEIDQTYGMLGSVVAEQVIAADGPIREYYIINDADDPADFRTEVCWPIRRTVRDGRP